MPTNKVQDIGHVVCLVGDPKFCILVLQEAQRFETKGFSVSFHYQIGEGRVSCMIVAKGVKRTITAE